MADKEMLLDLTRQVLDLKKEKKKYNANTNVSIKALEEQIEESVVA